MAFPIAGFSTAMKEQIIEATAQDYVEVYGVPAQLSMRIFQVVEDGVRLALFGYYFTAGCVVVFCKIIGKFSARKIYRVAKKCMAKLLATGLPLTALADSELCTASNFLSHLGFRHALSCDSGDVYQYD